MRQKDISYECFERRSISINNILNYRLIDNSNSYSGNSFVNKIQAVLIFLMLR